MALITRDTPPHVAIRRQVLRLALSVAGGSVAFVLVLAVAAWLTRDTRRGVPPEERVAPPPAFVVDAGALPAPDPAPIEHDAGVFVTVAGDVDGGPAAATPPPVDAAAIGARVQAVAQGCVEEVLRFDPSLGGRGEVTLVFGAQVAPRAALAGVASPLFSRCMLARTEALALPTPSERVRVQVRLSIDGLRGVVAVDNAELFLEVTPP